MLSRPANPVHGPTRRAGRHARLLLIAGAGLLLLAPLRGLAARTVQQTLAPAGMQALTGFAVSVPLRSLATWPWRVAGDDRHGPDRSTLRLREDGRPLGPAHALHDAIGAHGAGRFSHWRHALLFSSGDGTDPRTNGRRYEVVASARLAPGLLVGAALTGVLLMVSGLLSGAAGPAAGDRTRRAGGATLALVGLAVIALALFLRGQGRPVDLVLPAAGISPLAGQAWVVEPEYGLPWPWHPPGDDLRDHARSDLRLFQDGRQLGPPHTVLEELERLGAGRYAHWGRRLLFSTPDGSDPRTNGHVYRVTVTARIDHHPLRQLWLFGGALLVVGLLGWLSPGAWRITGTPGRWLRGGGRRVGDWLLAAAIPTLAAWFAWTAVPPLWNNSDSVVWLLWQLQWIPHHPPVYPLLMGGLQWATGDEAGMLRGAMLLQHLVQILGVAWLATAFHRRWHILLIATVATIGSGYGLFSHGLLTAGLALPLMLLFLGASLRLWRDGLTGPVAVALLLTLVLASLARYLLIVLAVIPLLYLLLRMPWEPPGQRGWPALGAALLLLAGALSLNSGLNGSLSLLLDAQQAPVIGRAGVYRIQATWQQVPVGERGQWLARLQDGAADPALRAAWPLLATAANPWTGPSAAILHTPAWWGLHPDELMAAAFRQFVLTPDGFAWRQWFREFAAGLFGISAGLGAGGDGGQVRLLLLGSAQALEAIFPPEPGYQAAAAATRTGTDDPATAARYRALAAQPWAHLADGALPRSPLPRGLLLLASLALLVAVWRRGADPRAFALLLSLWGGALCYLAMLTLMTLVLPRYLAPFDLLIWLGNGIGVIVLVTARRQRGPVFARG